MRKSRQKKRHDELATDDMQKLIDGEGRAAFDRIRDAKFRGYRYEEGKRAQQVNVAAVARAIREAIEGAAPDEPDMWPGLRALENRVRKWRGEPSEKDERLANSESASADVY